MTFQYASDLHLEFRDNKHFVQKNPLQPSADILLLAGDVMPLHQLEEIDWFIDYISNHWHHVYWIPGNHEYYSNELINEYQIIQQELRPNVRIINNQAIILGDYRLLCTTLWSHIPPQFARQITSSLNDFWSIKYLAKKLNVEEYNLMHRQALSFLTENIKTPFEGKNIIITHHVPSMMHYPEQYKGDILNYAFAIELHDFISENKIDAWIYGHHHSNVGNYEIEGTQMLTNQLGYIAAGEGAGFKNDLKIEFK